MKKCFKKALSGILASAMLFSSVAIAPTSVFAAPSFGNVGGWFESIYAEIPGISDADVTGVSYSGTMSGSLSGQDLQYLVRGYNGGVRIDIPGLKEGNYTLTVTTSDGTVTKDNISVMAYDRSGYAHFNYTEGVGAYNDDGTLKDNAMVVYVTEDTKNTVTLSYGGKTVTGIGNILNSRGAKSNGGSATNSNQEILEDLGNNNIPLVVRIIGEVKAGDSNTSNNPPSENIDGLTVYDSADNGGTEGDNGMMARIEDAKNITIEGIGPDASMNGWGIHFVCGTAAYAAGLGKSCEIRNIYFQNYPEDAFGAEGQQSGSTLTAPVERIWVHNNNFGPGYCKNPTESDKSEGDGSCDFKRGQFYTMAYNKYWDCHKTNLIGSSDSSLQYHMSMHHNYYENCMARGPLARQGNIHMYNNVYIGQTDYAMNTRANAYIFSEYNLFYMCKNPMRVDAGAIKSYNDSLSSCIEEMGGTVVTDRSQKVSSGNKYENFDTNSSLSYIPSGDYNIQEDITEAKKVVMAYTGVMKEDVITPDEVSVSLVDQSKQPANPVSLPWKYDLNSTNVAKGVQTLDDVYISASKVAGDSITLKEGQAIVFAVNTNVNITITDGGASYPVALMNEAGEECLTGSGTAYNLPAGTYFIQPTGFSPAKDGGEPSYKESKIAFLGIEEYDPNGTTVEYTTQATTEGDIETTTRDQGGDVEEPTEGTTSAPYEGEGLVWDYTNGTNTLNANVDANDWSDAAPVSYNGSTFTSAVKMESSTNITFKVPANGKLTLVTYSGKGEPIINVNGEEVVVNKSGATTIDISGVNGANAVSRAVSINAPDGTVTLTKGTTDTYLYAIEFIGAGSTPATTTEATTEATTADVEEPTETTTEKTETTTEAPEPVGGVSVSVGDVSGVKVGDTVTVPVKVTGLDTLANYDIDITYDASKLEVTAVTNGDMIDVTDDTFVYNTSEAGLIHISAVNTDDLKGGEVLFNVTFTGVAEGTSNITLTVNELFAENSASVEYTVDNGVVTVADSSIPPTGIKGDVDKDGDVDSVDAAIVLKIVSGIITDTAPYDTDAADYDEDGDITVLDAVAILRASQGGSEEPTETTTEAAVGEGSWSFDYSELTAAADKEAIADGTKVGTDGFFTITGEVTKRTNSETGAVSSIEIQKAELGAVTFTVTEDSYVEFDASSTGTTNTSAIGLKSSDGTFYVNTTVTGSANGRTTFAANVPAGTYSIVSPLDEANDRGARVYSVSVETGSKEITTSETTTETTTEAPVVTPGGFVETVNANDLGVATYTSAFNAGKFVITADATNTVAVDTNNKSIDGYSFTQRIKLGGAGTVDYRSIKFNAASAGNVIVYAMSSNSAQTRTMNLLNASGEVVKSVSVPGDAIGKYTIEIPSAGTYYIASESGGLNVYMVATDVALN